MTREEAITVLKGLSDNPSFSNQHKTAFNIAIHDIKQRHDWVINKLILVPKTAWEQEPIIDKIRAEIDEQYDRVHPYNVSCAEGLEMALGIIDKYKAESEPQEEEKES